MVDVSAQYDGKGSLTDTERILVISLLVALFVIIVCLIILIALTCRKNIRNKSGKFNRSVYASSRLRRSSDKPIPDGKVKLSLSRLNSRYSDIGGPSSPPVTFQNMMYDGVPDDLQQSYSSGSDTFQGTYPDEYR